MSRPFLPAGRTLAATPGSPARRTRARLACAALICQGALAATAALAQASADPPRAPASAPVRAASCADFTERAAAVDVAAARAQAQRAAAAEQAPLLERSIELWRQAAELCSGRAQSRALRSLADSQRLRQELGDVQGAGAKCSAAQRDAQSIESWPSRP
jgi:hypothetical protein